MNILYYGQNFILTTTSALSSFYIYIHNRSIWQILEMQLMLKKRDSERITFVIYLGLNVHSGIAVWNLGCDIGRYLCGEKKTPQNKCIQTHQLSHTEHVEEHDILT